MQILYYTATKMLSNFFKKNFSGPTARESCSLKIVGWFSQTEEHQNSEIFIQLKRFFFQLLQ